MRPGAAAAVFIAGLAFSGIGQATDPAADQAIPIPLYESIEDVPRRTDLPLVLVFFSTACPACWDDLFAVRQLIGERGFDCELVGVTRDSEREVRAFLEKYGFAGPVVRDARKRLFRAHAVELEPAAVVIEDGRVVYKDDAYRDYPSRREELKTWMTRRSAGRISA
jgi:peroxiredoxin